MRKFPPLLCAFFAVLLCSSLTVAAQPKKPVTWKFTSRKIAADLYELRFTATIDKGWHLYSQIETADIIFPKNNGKRIEAKIVEDGLEAVKYRKPNEPSSVVKTIARAQVDSIRYAEGPMPTAFEFEPAKTYSLVGKTSEPKPTESREPLFNNAIVRSFEHQAVFTQQVRALAAGSLTIRGSIAGQTCNDNVCSQFSPPIDFNFVIEGAEVERQEPADTVRADSGATDHVQGTPSATDNTPVLRQTPAGYAANKSTYLGLFITGFLGGLLALLTPCVFPMIPMTVSFFIKQSKTKASGIRNALVYAISIIAIYITLGLGVTLIFGADAVNSLATNVWFNLAFFVLLIVFAISFLGAFEITLPSSFVNRMDARSDRGGFIGIFFMAFTLGLVSFSCTGPIIGTLLVQAAATRALAAPFLGMLGFSLALALPFGLFAAFPGWLNSLPKSGGWLNAVKVVLGFLELALALKFLSNADLVVQAGVITREVFLVIWIAIFALLGAYLMGWFRLSHDSELKHISVGRLLFAVLVFSFTTYLVPGLWGAPLKLIAGFPPPDFYSESPDGVGKAGIISASAAVDTSAKPKGLHSGPHGIPTFDDYYHAIEFARKTGKPLMIDFTGWACVNCRRMESQVWIDPAVKRRLSEDFILVSLYVDDKKSLPDELRKEVEWNGTQRLLKSVGNRWSYLQNTKYDSSTQPQYWIIDADEKRYALPTSYDPDIEKFIHWLDEGHERFKNKMPL